jgi:hypothetical protein
MLRYWCVSAHWVRFRPTMLMPQSLSETRGCRLVSNSSPTPRDIMRTMRGRAQLGDERTIYVHFF